MTDVRERERRDLVELARSVTMRPDRVILVSGEAGSGKTHLARQVVAELADDGFGVAWGRADPVERALPYAAISQVLGSLSTEATARAWAPNGGAGPDAVLHDVYRPVAALLETHCEAGPLVVAIDDLHFADEDTLVLIGFLVRRLVNLPIVWLFTSRQHLADPAPGLVQLLHRLTEDRRLDEVVLDHLTSGDVARVVTGTVGPVEDAAMTSIVERAAGNPFFAIQLGLSLGETDGSNRGVPSVSRRGALLERVFPLGEAARAVARFASVRGAVDIDELDALATALRLDSSDLQDGFDRLVRADLLRVGETGRYEFVHDLVRETIYDDCGPAERRRLHGLAAQSLLERRARGDDVDVVELANHLAAGSLGPDARAVDALRQAGDALVGSSPRSAALRYRQAIGHLVDGGAEATELHVRVAGALRRAGDPAAVVQVCREALATAGDGEWHDRLTRYLATALADTGAIRDAVDLIDAELARRGSTAVLLSTRSSLLRLLDDFDGSLVAVEEAATAVRSTAEAVSVLFERLNIAVDLGRGGQGEVALAELERLIPALDPPRRMMAHTHAAGACAGFGEARRGAGHLQAAEALAATGVLDIDWSAAFAARVALANHRGELDDAVRTYEKGAPEFGSGLRLLVRNTAATSVGDVASLRRDPLMARRLVDDIVELTPQARRLKELARSKLDVVEGRPVDSVARLERALSDVAPAWQVTMYYLISLIHTLAAEGSRTEARRHLEPLRNQDAQIGSVLSRVLLAAAETRVTDDVDAGRAGLELAVEHELVRYEAELRYDLGRLGVDSETNLLTTRRIYESFGASVEMAMTEAEMRRQGLRVPTRRGEGLALTDAESRVADLVAEGLTNRAIAERLAYSVKTIEAYLSRVYAKTGCSNRVELARYLSPGR